MRKFCLDFACEEPSDKSVNQTFNHQVKYSRRRIKTVRPRGVITDPTLGGGALNNSNGATGLCQGGRKAKKTGGKKGRKVGRANLRY